METATNAQTTVKLTIDGRAVEVERGKTVLEAAEKLGVHIPTLCHHPELKPAGFCRICLVEVVKGKRKRYVASCCYPAEEGILVTTVNPRIAQIRRLLVELMWPAYRQRAKEFGITESRFHTEQSDCSHCGLCVRYCNEVVKKDAIYFHGRGVDRRVAFTPGMAECDSCRRCFHLCTGGFLITEHGKASSDIFE